MEHKGYIGSVRFSDEDEVFHGKLQGIRVLEREGLTWPA